MKQKFKFGIEEEVFLFEASGFEKGVSQKELMRLVAQNDGYRITHTDPLDKMPIQINKDFRNGYVSIKFDSTFNILEIAYPPTNSLQDFYELSKDLWSRLFFYAQELGLSFKRQGYLPSVLDTKDFFSKDSVQKTLLRDDSGKPHFDRFYPGKICATQIHVEMTQDQGFQVLRSLYNLEPLIPAFFSNSAVPGIAHCYRLLLLQDAFKDSYKFFGFPGLIASTRTDYEQLQSSAPGFWRDYSLIVPRVHGTWEFRSACVQPSIEGTVNIAAFRLAILAIIQNENIQKVLSQIENAAEVYAQACLTPDHQIFTTYLNYLKEHGVLQSLKLEMEKNETIRYCDNLNQFRKAA